LTIRKVFGKNTTTGDIFELSGAGIDLQGDYNAVATGPTISFDSIQFRVDTTTPGVSYRDFNKYI
jgi:hypothetical protein